MTTPESGSVQNPNERHAEDFDMHWKDRAVTIWQASIATITLLIVICGGLLSIYLTLHDISVKIGNYDKVQDRISTLEVWKNVHEQQAQSRDREIEEEKKRIGAQDTAIQALSTAVATLNAQANRR